MLSMKRGPTLFDCQIISGTNYILSAFKKYRPGLHHSSAASHRIGWHTSSCGMLPAPPPLLSLSLSISLSLFIYLSLFIHLSLFIYLSLFLYLSLSLSLSLFISLYLSFSLSLSFTLSFPPFSFFRMRKPHIEYTASVSPCFICLPSLSLQRWLAHMQCSWTRTFTRHLLGNFNLRLSGSAVYLAQIIV